jgi:ketosteroid isomerase-like protein
MTAKQTEKCVLAFLEAFYAGDIAGLERCCHDALTSITYTPVEIFPHHGLKQGKSWVAEAVRVQQQRYSQRTYAIQTLVVDGDRAAVIVAAHLTKHKDGRVVQLTIAEFFTLRDGLIIEHRAFFDSFDFIQQLLGRDLSEQFASSVAAAMRA